MALCGALPPARGQATAWVRVLQCQRGGRGQAARPPASCLPAVSWSSGTGNAALEQSVGNLTNFTRQFQSPKHVNAMTGYEKKYLFQ